MKIMFSAGEASGDMHAAAVAAELKKNHPDIEMLGMGGPAMKRAGVRIVYDIENLGVIGVVEIIKHIPFFFRLRDYIRRVVEKEKPDVFVCVDYPGFNMKLAHMVSQMGILHCSYHMGMEQGTRQKYCQRCGLCSFYFPF